MDIRGSVSYRGLELNVVELSPPEFIGGGKAGIELHDVSLSDVDVVQVAEKSALKDGMDMGDTFLGGRTLNANGVIAGNSRADFYDRIRVVRSTFNPRLAYLADPENKGFHPFQFSVPTNLPEFDDHKIDLISYLTPRMIRTDFNRKSHGGAGRDADALALIFTLQMVAADPLLYGAEEVVLNLLAPSTTLLNRGDFPAVVVARWTVGSSAGTIVLTIDGVAATITVPAGSVGRVIEYDGHTKLLSLTDTGITSRRMDLMSIPVHPEVPVGSASWSHLVTGGATVSAATLTYRETYA